MTAVDRRRWCSAGATPAAWTTGWDPRSSSCRWHCGAPAPRGLDADYQLTVEDAADVARYRRVLFVDADRAGPAPFRLERDCGRHDSTARASARTASAPGAVLALSRDLFQAEPEAWLLGIRGYEFDEFGERLSDRARANLAQCSRTCVRSAIESDGFRTRSSRNRAASAKADRS